jgi:hypothetical protein
MPTSDGISDADWTGVRELAVDLVNAADTVREHASRSRLLTYLDQLEAKYGPLPRILATRADFVDGFATKERLLLDAYAVAMLSADSASMLFIAESLAELYIENSDRGLNADHWLARMREILDDRADADMEASYQALRHRHQYAE